MGGGAWPFVVGVLICLVDFDNERDGEMVLIFTPSTVDASPRKFRNNRSVMPLDVLGRTRATLIWGAGCEAGRPNESRKTDRNGDYILQLLYMNEESLVYACHQRA